MPLQRLTRSQYAHTIRDLLGVASGVVDLLPADGKLGVFRSNANAPVAQLDVQQYGEAAEKIVARVPNLDSLVPCDRGGLGATTCASRFITAFGLRVHRRPLDATERSEYEALFAAVGGVADYNGGISAVLHAMLQSPAFLYLPELSGATAVSATAIPLTPFELATRLSFFLWDSTPDATLLDAAAQNGLGTPAQIAAAARRMLADPRAAAALGSFHEQWLELDTLAVAQKDPQLYPMYSPQMATEMVDETLRFASYVILQGDGRLATLLTAPYSFPGPSVRGLYGLPPMANPAMTPVMLDPARRGGLLTQPAFLAAHAHANQSSPVTRGKAIRVNLLCDPPAPPPPDVNTVPPDPAPGLTTRQRFAVHEAQARCAACHVAMDPIGFGFESYDALGVYRTLDAGQPVDARGQMSFTDVDGPFNGAVELAAKLAGSNQVRMCVTKQWFQYAFGRAADADVNDACSYWSVLGAFQTSGFNVRELLIAIVSADAFRFRRAP